MAYHNIPTYTPHSGYHGVTEVAKTANVPKMGKKCISCINARPTPPHINPMGAGPGNTFSAENKKNHKIHDFRPKKRGGWSFSDTNPPPTPPSLKSSKKVGFKWGEGILGVRTKTHWGMCLFDKIMILQGVKLTAQPLGVGYTNKPKNAQNGGVCGVFPYIRLPGFDLTTAAR